MPKDPVILLSYVNMKLRDFYPSFEELCAAEGEDPASGREILADVNYEYDPEANQFVTRWGAYPRPEERPKYPWET